MLRLSRKSLKICSTNSSLKLISKRIYCHESFSRNSVQNIQNTSMIHLFFIKKEASCLQNKNRFYSIFSCFLGHVMFWTSARCWQFRQDRFRLSCTHSAVSSWNAKRWSSLFLEKLNYRKHIYFTVLFSPDKKLLSKPLQQYYFYYIRIQFDTWDW